MVGDEAVILNLKSELYLGLNPVDPQEVAMGQDGAVWVGDPGKATAELGWRAEDDLPTGFAALADWLRDHRDLWPRYEIEEG